MRLRSWAPSGRPAGQEEELSASVGVARGRETHVRHVDAWQGCTHALLCDAQTLNPTQCLRRVNLRQRKEKTRHCPEERQIVRRIRNCQRRGATRPPLTGCSVTLIHSTSVQRGRRRNSVHQCKGLVGGRRLKGIWMQGSDSLLSKTYKDLQRGFFQCLRRRFALQYL